MAVDLRHVIRRSTPPVNASSAPVTPRRSTPTSSDEVVARPSGTHTTGSRAPLPPRPGPPATGRRRRSRARPLPPPRLHRPARPGLARREDDGLDPLLARPLGQPGARRLADTRPRVDKNTGPRGGSRPASRNVTAGASTGSSRSGKPGQAADGDAAAVTRPQLGGSGRAARRAGSPAGTPEAQLGLGELIDGGLVDAVGVPLVHPQQPEQAAGDGTQRSPHRER